MKRYIHHSAKNILRMIVASCLCMACGSNHKEIPVPPVPPTPPDPEPVLVPIELSTSILSRAVTDQFADTPIEIVMGTDSFHIAEVWDATANGTNITLTPVHYYPTDSTALYLRGFYPRTPLTEGKADYTLSGKEDILFAGLQTGSLKAPFTAGDKTVAFKHLLAQLTVSLLTDKEFQGSYRLKYMGLNGSAAKASLDILSGTLQFGTESTTLEIYRSDGFTGLTVEAGARLELGNILIQPQAELTMDLVLAKDEDAANDIIFTALPVEFEGGDSESGLSYTLSIKLPNKLEPDKPDPDDPDKPDPDKPDPDDPDKPVPDPSVELKLYAKISPWMDIPLGDITLDKH